MLIGFEIHQQLETHKLFCSCPSVLREEKPEVTIERRLRPTQSELGEIDRAALEEFLKGKSFVYEVYPDTTCLVELDEEPPHEPNEEAIDICIEVASMLNCDIADEIHFMRKLVIDGSNTSGFQRTAIIALDGYLETDKGRIGIPMICLEEEAARKIAEKGKKTIYRLDRLGIPLIEITTAPDITTPEQAREVALKIGKILRDTGKVKRGIGTIRQDINVSVEGGARVEIKGAQELNQIPKIIEFEVERQRKLIEVKEELKNRKISLGNFRYDVSEIFKGTASKIIAAQLKENGRVLALKLGGFKGLLSKKLGPEFAQYAIVAAGVKGVFHSDELPAYGISQEEVNSVSKKLALGKNDAFVFVAEKKEAAERALEAVLRRARLALEGVVEETRAVNQDATTSYMRPLPGAARMYPETDIPPIAITRERISRIKANLPELYEEKKKRYVKLHKLSEEMASQLLASSATFDFGIEKKPAWKFFEEVVEEIKIAPSIAANTLLGTLKDLKRDGYETESIGGEKLKEVFRLVAENKMAKEAIPKVLAVVAKNPVQKVENVVRQVGIGFIGEDEIEEAVRNVLKVREEFVREKGLDAAKPLMGVVMKELRGRADGKLVSEMLRRELKKFLGK